MEFLFLKKKLDETRYSFDLRLEIMGRFPVENQFSNPGNLENHPIRTARKQPRNTTASFIDIKPSSRKGKTNYRQITGLRIKPY